MPPKTNHIKSNDILARLESGAKVSLYDYMRFCLLDENYGYYRNKKAIGQAGDFTTSPEISQVFGDCIGFWLLDLWQRCGAPQKFTLIELGGGRGSLMRDILSLMKGHEAFAAIKVIMVDINPHFRNLQKQALADFADKVTWAEELSHVTCEGVVAVIGNEFLDALPIRQFRYSDGAWQEVFVAKQGADLQFAYDGADLQCANEAAEPDLPTGWDGLYGGAVYEYAPELPQVMQRVAELAKHGGALLIDYGYAGRQAKGSLQAVRAQQYAEILPSWEDLRGGDKIPDLSAHVDFGAAAALARGFGAEVLPLMNQHEFLGSMGGALRLQKLLERTENKDSLVSGYERVVDLQGMGGLFKVLMLYGENSAHAG